MFRSLLSRTLCFLARDAQDFENGFGVDVIESGRGSHSASFRQTGQNAVHSLFWNVKRFADSFGLRERLAAAGAFKARRVLFSVATVNVGLCVAAIGHCIMGLESSCDLAHKCSC